MTSCRDHFKSPSRVRNFTSPDFSQIEEVHFSKSSKMNLLFLGIHASYFVTEFLFFGQSLAHPLMFILWDVISLLVLRDRFTTVDTHFTSMLVVIACDVY